MSDGRPTRVGNTAGGGDLLSTLTARELQVLQLYITCFNAKKVARLLGTKPQTVKNQLASIEHKLGVASREEMVAAALKAIGS
jgi:DNA-binding CsgD family transcriptional regulator